MGRLHYHARTEGVSKLELSLFPRFFLENLKKFSSWLITISVFLLAPQTISVLYKKKNLQHFQMNIKQIYSALKNKVLFCR